MDLLGRAGGGGGGDVGGGEERGDYHSSVCVTIMT